MAAATLAAATLPAVVDHCRHGQCRQSTRVGYATTSCGSSRHSTAAWVGRELSPAVGFSRVTVTGSGLMRPSSRMVASLHRSRAVWLACTLALRQAVRGRHAQRDLLLTGGGGGTSASASISASVRKSTEASKSTNVDTDIDATMTAAAAKAQLVECHKYQKSHNSSH